MKTKITIYIIFLLTQAFGSFGQDYLGAGRTTGVKVSTSSNLNQSTGIKTIDGSGLDAKMMEAARFFYQASFGADLETIKAFAKNNNPYDQWIEAESKKSPTLLLPKLTAINIEDFNAFLKRDDDGDGKLNDPDDYFGPWAKHFSYAWWDNVNKAPDQMRYKIAHALSQILVVSMNSDLRDHGEAVADYYDIFIRNAFGNFKDILREVTYHPAMGYYLSHLNNPKSDPENNQHPDQNFAREIMQLFTIGLYELNLDGTRKLDNSGQPIPTYDNNDIAELAKVFTGMGGGDLNNKVKLIYPNLRIDFGYGLYTINRTIPMYMWDEHHEPGPKTIVGGYTIPAGQSGRKDVEDALNHLFNHPNVGPFIAHRMIQRLITSNPTPQYIERVASVFNDNGQGIRGDMKALMKAILLDPEARNCETLTQPYHGQLREPIMRYTHVLRAIRKDSPTGNYWKDPLSTLELMKQTPMGAPTVFNFYKTDFQPLGAIQAAGLVAPEFQILDSETAIGYVNQTLSWSFYELAMYDWEDNTENVEFIFDELADISEDAEKLINRLDILFTYGQMTDPTRTVIRQALKNLAYPVGKDLRAKMAIYLTLISPDYTILK